MEGDNAGVQAPFNPGQMPQAPPLDNIHAQHQTMDTGADISGHFATPTHASVCNSLPLDTYVFTDLVTATTTSLV